MTSDDATTSAARTRIPGALVRTHLANERTFLAWVRTGLAAIALGVGAAQLLDHTVIAGIAVEAILSVSLVGFGLLLVLVGRYRYRQAAIGIRDGAFRVHRRGLDVVVIGSIVVAVIAVVFIARA